MKKNSLLMFVFIFGLIMLSCQSNEEKAQELIRKEFFQTLNDFDSYEPIKTVVKEAKKSATTDPECFAAADLLTELLNNAFDITKEMRTSLDHMELWVDSYTAQGERKYNEYKKEFAGQKEQVVKNIKTQHIVLEKLKNSVTNMDTTIVVGWEIYHRFRCKDNTGQSFVKDYRFVATESFDKILIKEDATVAKYEKIRKIINEVISGEYEKTLNNIGL